MFCLMGRRCFPSLRSGSHLILSSCQRVASRSAANSPDIRSVRLLLKPAAFACAFTGVVYGGAAIATYESHRQKYKNFVHRFRDKRRPFGLTDGQFVALTIAAVNVIVFLCFRVKRWEQFMDRYFTLTAMTSRPSCLPLSLATFNHKDIFHLSVNMFVLFSFAQSGVAVLGKEQFVALYLSAGVFSSLISMGYKVLTKTAIPSVGASGAIVAIFALHCLSFPDSRIQIVFLPFVGTSALYALPAMALVDTMGLLFKWRWLDHSAHLAGAAFGTLYFYYGRSLYQQYGTAVARKWHTISSTR